MRSPWYARLILPGAAALWGLLVMAGLGALHAYESAPGAVGDRSLHWPEASRVPRDRQHANLVLLAHPRCSCTRATLEELGRILALCPDRVSAHVLFYRPSGEAGSWSDTDLKRRAAAIPGVRVLDDPDGQEAARFGALTSGHTLVYDHAGRLVYSGGLTAARGRTGANPGSDSVSAILTRESVSRPDFPVFGCPIAESSSIRTVE